MENNWPHNSPKNIKYPAHPPRHEIQVAIFTILIFDKISSIKIVNIIRLIFNIYYLKWNYYGLKIGPNIIEHISGNP